MRRIEEFWIEFNPPAEPEEKPSWMTALFFDVVDSVKGAVIVVFLIFALFFKAVGVDGDSMFPTLRDGDWVAVSGVTTKVERGDIVVVTQPWERNVPIIKRVIAIGGDVVDIDFETNEVFVNGFLLEESYIAEPTRFLYPKEASAVLDWLCTEKSVREDIDFAPIRAAFTEEFMNTPLEQMQTPPTKKLASIIADAANIIKNTNLY